MELSGATVLVTGASSGIGAATARALAAGGAHVLVAGRNSARLRAVAAETGGLAVEADLAAPDGPARLASAALRAAASLRPARGRGPLPPAADMLPLAACPAVAPTRRGPETAGLKPARFAGAGVRRGGSGLVATEHSDGSGRQANGRGPKRNGGHAGTSAAGHLAAYRMDVAGRDGAPATGGIDILINNAGIGWAGPLTEMSPAKVAELVAVNLTAPIELTRLLAPTLATGGRGRVVFISSIAGATGAPQEAVYAATKAGLNYFAESLRYELAGSGVGVSVIVPGVIDTPFFALRGKPYNRSRPVPISAQRAARAVRCAIEREQPMVFVPRWLRFPAWLHGVAPGPFQALATRFG